MPQKQEGHGGPRRGAGRPKKVQLTDTIRVEVDVADMVTFVAKRRRLDVADLVSPEMRKWILPLYRDEHQKLLDQSKKLPAE